MRGGLVIADGQQMPFDGEYMWIVLSQLTQRACQSQQIFRIAPAWALCCGNLAGNVQLCCWPEKSSVFRRGDIHQTLGTLVVIKHDVRCQPQITVLFPIVEMGKHFRRDQVSHAGADGMRLFNQGYYASGRFNRAAVIMRALPETAAPATDVGWLTCDEWKVGLEYQRTITEQPYAVVLVELGHGLIAGNGIGRHRQEMTARRDQARNDGIIRPSRSALSGAAMGAALVRQGKGNRCRAVGWPGARRGKAQEKLAGSG